MIYNTQFETKKTIFSYIKGYLLVALLAVLLTLVVSLLLGCKFFLVYEVGGSSARPYIAPGSFILVQKVSEVEIGDFVTYGSGSSYVTHRVVEVHEDGTFVTSQTGGGPPDMATMSFEDSRYVGKVIIAIPYAYQLINYVKTHIIHLIAFVFLLYYIANYFTQEYYYELNEGGKR